MGARTGSGATAREAMMDADRDAERVDEAHDGAPAGAVCLLDGTATVFASAFRSSAEATDSPKPMNRAASPRLTR